MSKQFFEKSARVSLLFVYTFMIVRNLQIESAWFFENRNDSGQKRKSITTIHTYTSYRL